MFLKSNPVLMIYLGFLARFSLWNKLPGAAKVGPSAILSIQN